MAGDSDITYIDRDLRTGMTIQWSEPPDYLDVTAVSAPDGDGMVTIDTGEGPVRDPGADR